MSDFSTVQTYMKRQGFDAWLVYDFRGSNPILAQLLPGKRWTTRRTVLFIPVIGEPVLLVHGIDRPSFRDVTCRQENYLTWRDLRNWLEEKLSGKTRVAMEYAPGGTLPVVSIVDAGTVELVRSIGVEVVSSANLIQVCVAAWSPSAREGHALASRKTAVIKDEAFAMIRDRVGGGKNITEYDVQQFIVERFKKEGLENLGEPICAVNAHSGDPHYEPSAGSSSPIRVGDWVLIDLWARLPGDENVSSDITWVGFVGKEVPSKHRKVFEAVRAARDRCVERAIAAWKSGEVIQGWQLDEAAREVIVKAGFEQGIRHRTGHSLSPGPSVHGLGMNLDNLETHDTREMLPSIGFTIEPGIYLPEFGVRLEINLFVDPKTGPLVTCPIQKEVILLG